MADFAGRLALRDRAPQILVLDGGRIEAADEREAHQRADEQRDDALLRQQQHWLKLKGHRRRRRRK